MLELRHIYKTYNPQTVNEHTLYSDFNLKIDEGEFVTVVGSNGSGKTSMLNVICGTIEPDGGKVLINDHDITDQKEFVRHRRIGRVFQDPAKGTCPSMNIIENLSIADNKGRKYGLGRGVNKARIGRYRDLLSELGLGLEDQMYSPVGSLSGGQRQALALIMATIQPLEFLILDEHTAALDPKTAEIIMELTDRIVREKHVTTIMVTHNIRYAVDYGSRILMMHQGRIILDKKGQEKENLMIDDVLDLFNEISIELGN